MTVAILVVISLPGLVHAQSDTDTAPVILLHPGVATVFQLPDAILDARVRDRGEIRLAVVGDELFVRPRPGTRAGMKAPLEVETRTARWTFQLVVVARARDARRDVRVEAIDVQASEESPREAPPAIPAEQAPPLALPVGPVVPPPAATPEAAARTASAPNPAPALAEPEPTAPESASAGDGERTVTTAMVPRLILSAHVVAGLGFTGLDIAGYQPVDALQNHYVLGLRLVGASRVHCLSLEADVSAEWPAGSMLFKQDLASTSNREVTGTRLRGEVGVRASAGRRWISSVQAGIGLQVHLRQTSGMSVDLKPETVATLSRGAVLMLGLGLQHRMRSTLLGLDFQVRQGGPDDYFSVAAFLTWGRILDQGE